MGLRSALGFWLLAVFATAGFACGNDVVTIEPQPESLIVKIQNEEFTVFHFGRDYPKPYFWPVRGSDGAVLTRPIEPGEKEHPHHKGIWVAVDEVNEIKFWAEKGKIATREVTSASGNPATIQVKNEWLSNEGAVILKEHTKVSIFPNRTLIFDIRLSIPAGQLVRFDDTKEGFLAIRIAESMREKVGGLVVNSEGQKATAGCWGQNANWVDYTGEVNGKQYGVALMDFPENFRRSRYHVRDYGLFSLSPFGEGVYQNDVNKAQPVILDDSKPSLRLRYGIFVHDGGPTDVAEAYAQFLKCAASARAY